MILTIKHIDGCAILLLLVSLVAGGFFIYQDYHTAQREIQQEQQLLNKQKNDMDMAQVDLARLKGVLTDKQSTFERLNQRIPESAQIGRLLTEIHERISQRNTTLTTFSHTPPEKGLQYQRIPLQLTLEGQFVDLYLMIHDLETLNRVFVIESVEIKRHETQETCRADIKANVYQD
nr:type 4a pilus biogenesis protein PilO [uncultured Desulfobacter sp.]